MACTMASIRARFSSACLAASLLTAAAALDREGLLSTSPNATAESQDNFTNRPYLLPLRREVIPLVKNGRTVSHKSAYFGSVSIGGPVPQDFSVVFDTGSGHVVVPSLECKSQTCRAKRRYNISASDSAAAINSDGSLVPPDELADQVTIGFGTGTVLGEFVRETVCVGPGAGKRRLPPAASANKSALRGPASVTSSRIPCSAMTMIMAVEMSEHPFQSFSFDGLFGLGLGSLALGPDFSFFERFAAETSAASVGSWSRFGIFLSAEDDGAESEIAIGGHNEARLAEPLQWAPVVKPKLGYWQVQVHAIRVGGVELKACSSGACRAILDTGTSHFGVPKKHLQTFTELLSVPASLGLLDTDCRRALAPEVSIDLGNFTITLHPEDYMRPEPQHSKTLTGNALSHRTERSEAARAVSASPTAVVPASSEPVAACKPRLMPVNLKEPLGPNLFILGEPVLHRYYTVYDWRVPKIGFGRARRKNFTEESTATLLDEQEVEMLEQEEVYQHQILLVQVSLTLSSRPRASTLKHEGLHLLRRELVKPTAVLGASPCNS